MNISSKFIIFAALAALMPAFAIAAEIVEDDPYVAPTPKKTIVSAAALKTTPAAAVKSAPSQEPAVKSAVSPETVAELKSKLEDLNKTVASLKDEIKALEDKNIEAGNVAKDLELYKKNLEDLQNKNGEDGKKLELLEKSFDGIQDTLKSKMDKMSSWDDILDVLKKGISNNELEIARLKKEINGLKKQYGGGDDNVFDAIVQWPYSGFVALIISIAAFITVVVK
jgi:septal ring factor EnvC (AmiA/AmiB activator)